jgi:hypothetical protein
MRVHGTAVLVLLGVLVSCSERGAAGKPPPAAALGQLHLLHAAGAATRLVVSPHGKRAAAELGGRWRWEDHPATPRAPLIKVIDVDRDTTTDTAIGWALAVDDTGAVDYVARQPDGSLALARSHGGAPVALGASGDVELTAATGADFYLALASDGRAADALVRVARDTRKVVAKRSIRGAAALAIVAGTPWLASLDPATGECRIEAFDASLAPRWQVTVPGTAGDGGAILAGAGDRALLVIGALTDAGLAPHAAFALDARTGARLGTALPTIADGVDTLGAPATVDGAAVALAHYRPISVGSAGAEPLLRRVVRLDLASGALAIVFEPAAAAGPRRQLEQALAPIALAWDATHARLVVAPPSFAWSKQAGAPQPEAKSDGTGVGRDRPEVRGLVP